MSMYVSWQAPGDSIVRANFEPLWLTMGTLNVKVGALAMAAPAGSLLAAQLPPGRLPARLSAGLLLASPLSSAPACLASSCPSWFSLPHELHSPTWSVAVGWTLGAQPHTPMARILPVVVEILLQKERLKVGVVLEVC